MRRPRVLCAGLGANALASPGISKALGGKVIGGGVAVLKGGLQFVMSSDIAAPKPKRRASAHEGVTAEDVTAFASVFIDDDESESIDLQKVRVAPCDQQYATKALYVFYVYFVRVLRVLCTFFTFTLYVCYPWNRSWLLPSGQPWWTSRCIVIRGSCGLRSKSWRETTPSRLNC